MNFTEKQ